MEDENPVAYYVAQQRYAVIEKYCRYTERNSNLWRENTPEEKAYLVARNNF
jgi:uncharacterized protein (DUF924 family)